MNARDIIEAEGPKEFLRRHAPPPDPTTVTIYCPVQGNEAAFEDADADDSAGMITVEATPHVLALLRDRARPYPDERSWVMDDLYAMEVLSWCHDNGVKVRDAYERFPNNGIDVEGFMQHLDQQQQHEAEDPKSFLRRASSNKIWPSENYYLNTWKDGETWKDGSFCPGQVNEKNQFMQFDGMYDLDDSIYQALGVEGRDPTEAEEERFGQESERYMVPIHSAIEQGTTSGTVDGIAGRLHWQLVYDPSQESDEVRERFQRNFDGWTGQVVPVRPGQEYGTRITPKTDRTQWRAFGGNVDPMAEDLVQALLDGEDPKELFKANFGKPQGDWVVRIEYIDPHGPAHEDTFNNEREALEAFRQRYTKMGGGEWYLKLLFRPWKKMGQPVAHSKRILFASYDRGDRQLDADLKNGVPVLDAFRAYSAREKLASQIHKQAYKKFPNTGAEAKHWLSGEMVRAQTADDAYSRDEFFRDTWRRKSNHPPGCQCYHCQNLQRPTLRDAAANMERRKADAYKRWKRAVARAQRLGLRPPPEPRSGGYERYDY